MEYVQYYCKNYKELCECYEKYFLWITTNDPRRWYEVTKDKVNEKWIYIFYALNVIMFNWWEVDGVKTIFKAKVYDL